MKKAFVIVNPSSGGGRGRRNWPRSAEALRKAGLDFDFEETAYAGHARKLACEAARSGYSRVIAFGGDGTIHETVNGLTEGRKSLPILGVIGAGTGSDFARTLGLDGDLSKQVAAIMGQKTRRIDAGRVTYATEDGPGERVFINVVDAGLGAAVVGRLPFYRRIFGRRLAYVTATAATALFWRPRRIRILTDDGKEWEGDCLSVAIANGRYFGGGMPIAPGASVSDGRLDVVVIGSMGIVRSAVFLPLLYAGAISRLSNIRTSRTKEVTLDSEQEVGLDIDGESVGFLPATFQVLPGRLEVFCP